MMRSLFFLALCVSLSPAWAQATPAQTGSLASDPSYQTPVTVEMKIAPVGDVLKSIAKQAKVSVEPSMGLTDLKVTIFVKQLPAGLVLDKIANVLGCAWKDEKGLEIMVMSQDEKNQRLKYLDKEDAQFRAEAEKSARNIANAAATAGSFDEFVQNFAKDQPDQGAAPGGPIHFHRPQRAAPSGQSASPATYALGKVWANWSPSDWTAFWNGAICSAEMVPEGPPAQDPNRANQRVRPVPQYIFARYDVYGDHELQFAIPPNGSVPRVAFDEKQMRPTGEMADTPFGREVLAWPDLSGAEKAESFTRDLAAPAAPGPDGPIMMADQLESLHVRSAVPIVADAFRNQVRSDRRVSGSNAASWLASLQDVDQCFVRVEDGVAMVRHGRFWRLRQWEIPESLIQPLAHRADRLSLMDYATFLSELTPAQAATLSSLTPPVLDFPTEQIAYAIPALRFLGSLGSAPAVGTPIQYAQLGSNSQPMFMEAVVGALFGGGSWTSSGLAANPARYAFVLKSADVMDEGKLVPGVILLFGTSPEDAVKYTVPFPP